MLKTLKSSCKYFSYFYYVSFITYSQTTDGAEHCAGSNDQEMTQEKGHYQQHLFEAHVLHMYLWVS